jgi:glycosyltransferase involved in cell wall biosynthesis
MRSPAKTLHMSTDAESEIPIVPACFRPLVSIVLNNYNYGHFLRFALDSALAQGYQPCEVIVVDDGSTDNSREILDRNYRDRVKLIFQENGGQAAAVNSGFLASRGEIVIFLDSDDALHENAVEIVVQNWQAGLSKIQFPLSVIDGEGHEMSARIPRMPLDSGEVTPLLLKDGHYMTPPMSGNAFSRLVLDRLMPIPDVWRLAADAYLLHASPFFGEVKSLDRQLGFYRTHGKNISLQSQVSVSDTIQRLKAFLGTENLIRELIDSLAQSQAKTVSSRAVLGDFSYLKAEFALRKLEDLSCRRLVLVAARSFLKAIWRSHRLNFANRCALTCWTIAACLTPRRLSARILSFGLAPSQRPAWIKKLILRISMRRQTRLVA